MSGVLWSFTIAISLSIATVAFSLRQKAVAEQNIPEPTTILGWSLVVVGIAFRSVRKRARS